MSWLAEKKRRGNWNKRPFYDWVDWYKDILYPNRGKEALTAFAFATAFVLGAGYTK